MESDGLELVRMRLYGIYGRNVAQGQPCLSQGTLDVLVILFDIRTCTLDALVILFAPILLYSVDEASFSGHPSID